MRLIVFVLLCALAGAQSANVSGKLNLPPGTGAVNTFMRFQLVFCGNGKSAVERIGVWTGSQLVNFAAFDVPTTAGAWTVPLYGNDHIVCGTVGSGSEVGGSAWRVTPFIQGKAGPERNYVVGTGHDFVADTAPKCSSGVVFSCTVTEAPVRLAPVKAPVKVQPHKPTTLRVNFPLERRVHNFDRTKPQPTVKPTVVKPK